jgi:hypothetical protein
MLVDANSANCRERGFCLRNDGNDFPVHPPTVSLSQRERDKG